MQHCFVIVVLPLQPDRVGQAFLPCPVRALFYDFAPAFVLRRLGHVAVVLGSSSVVTLLPGQRLKKLRLELMESWAMS